ncbi:WG repeat-containing protein [Sulfurovum sp. bin170]|uniref:WG repeat-containing protein n=1 Tax=Sulfurovum sp. bin170 TaxID=2695268 RepID=UPI0013DF5CF4|nr:WG repeat-containing protein [Sulfurovum sp. bin170]NEW60396.1 WG repeat-containing protein [Sulfurovum sp. bin170]
MRLFLLSSISLLLLPLLFFGCSSTQIKEREEYSTYLSRDYLQNLDFSGQDLVATLIGNSWYYVREDGKAISVIRDDNGEADRFREGLARTRINGKIGFFNKTLDIVLKPIYDFAFPFHNGISEICVGCQEVKEGEHSMLNGGSWKRINRAGLILEE